MSSVESGKIILNANEAHVTGKKLYLENAYYNGQKLVLGSVGENVNENAGKYTYRQFYLYNQDGEYLNLNEPPMMFIAPEGLGVNLAPEFNDLSQGFFRHVDTGKVPQGNIVGDMLFDEIDFNPNTAYKTYRDFVDFTLRAERLFLGYIPAKNILTALTEYQCEVKLDYLNKSQINWSRCLRCPISFMMLTPWYKTTSVTITQTLDGSGWTEVNWSDIMTFNASEGNMPAAVVIRLYNGSTSFSVPRLRLVGVTSHKVYGEMSLTDSHEEITLSTKYDDCYVSSVWQGTTSDAMFNVDITKNPFFRLPLNEKTKLQIKVRTAVNSAKIDADIYNYYRSV